MKVKVCGITRKEQLDALLSLGVDYIGLIFYPASRRYAAGNDELKAGADDKSSKRVGVFVDAGREEILAAVKQYGLSMVQLHGQESPEFCRELQRDIPVIKAFGLTGSANVDAMVSPYIDSCSYFLFDTATEQHGGSGRKFDWAVLQQATVGKPFLLSGGITPSDSPSLKNFAHPYFFGIDINSKFETSPGVKDLPVVEQFLKNLHEENQHS